MTLAKLAWLCIVLLVALAAIAAAIYHACMGIANDIHRTSADHQDQN